MPLMPITQAKLEANPDLQKEITIAYCAGFFDGEGCIGIYQRQGYWTIQVTVSQKDPTALEVFRLIFPSYSESHHGVVTNLVWMGPAGAGVLFELLRYLNGKKSQAEAALELAMIQDTRRGRGNSKFTEDEKTRMAVLAQTVKDLKHDPQERGR